MAFTSPVLSTVPNLYRPWHALIPLIRTKRERQLALADRPEGATARVPFLFFPRLRPDLRMRPGLRMRFTLGLGFPLRLRADLLLRADLRMAFHSRLSSRRDLSFRMPGLATAA